MSNACDGGDIIGFVFAQRNLILLYQEGIYPQECRSDKIGFMASHVSWGHREAHSAQTSFAFIVKTCNTSTAFYNIIPQVEKHEHDHQAT